MYVPFLNPVKQYRTPPSMTTYNLQQNRNVVRWLSFSFFCIIFFLQYVFFSIEKFVILSAKYFIPKYCIYRNVIPQNLNSLLRLVVAKWTFAVWFHAFLNDLFFSMVSLRRLVQCSSQDLYIKIDLCSLVNVHSNLWALEYSCSHFAHYTYNKCKLYSIQLYLEAEIWMFYIEFIFSYTVFCEKYFSQNCLAFIVRPLYLASPLALPAGTVKVSVEEFEDVWKCNDLTPGPVSADTEGHAPVLGRYKNIFQCFFKLWQ